MAGAGLPTVHLREPSLAAALRFVRPRIATPTGGAVVRAEPERSFSMLAEPESLSHLQSHVEAGP